LELFFAIGRFSSARFQKAGRNTRRDVREMEFGLIPSRGKPPEVAQNALGGVSRIDNHESFRCVLDRVRSDFLVLKRLRSRPDTVESVVCLDVVMVLPNLEFCSGRYSPQWCVCTAGRRRQSFWIRYKRTIAGLQAFQ
jgi:hypothetical protein